MGATKNDAGRDVADFLQLMGIEPMSDDERIREDQSRYGVSMCREDKDGKLRHVPLRPWIKKRRGSV